MKSLEQQQSEAYMDQLGIIQYSIHNIGEALEALNKTTMKLKKVSTQQEYNSLVTQLTYGVGHITSSFNTMLAFGSDFFQEISPESEQTIGFRVDEDSDM